VGAQVGRAQTAAKVEKEVKSRAGKRKLSCTSVILQDGKGTGAVQDKGTQNECRERTKDSSSERRRQKNEGVVCKRTPAFLEGGGGGRASKRWE